MISIDLFSAKLDAVKTYMSLRRVPNNLEDRVIRWFVVFLSSLQIDKGISI